MCASMTVSSWAATICAALKMPVWVPAIWRRVMDPRVVAHYDGDVSRANIAPGKVDKYLARYPRAAVEEEAA